MARSEAGENIPFILESDTQLMVVVDPDQGHRVVKCLADTMCDLTGDHGITDLQLRDHDLVQQTTEACFYRSKP